MSTAVVPNVRPSNALPPGPTGTLLAGSLRDFTQHRLGFFVRVAREYGDLTSFRFGPRRIFLANHPDLIEQVLVTDAKHYIKHFGARNYMPVLGTGLVTSEGDFWLRQRRLSQPAFLKHRVHAYAPVMAELTRKMLDTWKAGPSTSTSSSAPSPARSPSRLSSASTTPAIARNSSSDSAKRSTSSECGSGAS